MVLVFKNARKGLLLKTAALLVFFFVNNTIVDRREKCDLFSEFQYSFRSSRSAAFLLTVLSDIIARTLNRCGTTRVVALDISKAFDSTNLSLTEFQVRYLTLFLIFSVIDGFDWFWMGSLHTNIQLMLEFFMTLY